MTDRGSIEEIKGGATHDILQEIVAHKRQELERMKTETPERLLHAEVERMLGGRVASLREAVSQSATGIIAEFKRRSPSKGWIKQEGKASRIPLSYQQQGAAAVSILTDSHYFGGCDTFVTEAREAGVTIPILYKNFVVDEYQLFQARRCGASAVLLIAACLSKQECRQLLRMAHELQLEVLLEMHGEQEAEYADWEPDLCGVNNRNLGSFVTSIDNSFRMASLLPAGAVKVSESGISHPDVIRELQIAGFQGFLIGETFMREDDPGEALGSFIREIQTGN
ncbi:MAG: indole-3-glycerol phosphate synthase TrpC [Prevotella sp.]|nr:indole-3-glycerol phosphate synthase TrpC [Prevotella sp.]